MTKLLRKSVKWRWDTEEQAAFDTLKERLASAPTLSRRLEKAEENYTTTEKEWGHPKVALLSRRIRVHHNHRSSSVKVAEFD